MRGEELEGLAFLGQARLPPIEVWGDKGLLDLLDAEVREWGINEWFRYEEKDIAELYREDGVVDAAVLGVKLLNGRTLKIYAVLFAERMDKMRLQLSCEELDEDEVEWRDMKELLGRGARRKRLLTLAEVISRYLGLLWGGPK